MKIGITGGIGSGKSFLCERLRAAGYPVYNCDNEAKRLMVASPAIRSRLVSLIGPEAYSADGRLSKAVVTDYLFASPSHAAAVDAIVHPAVRDDFRHWSSIQPAQHCFVESAILYEAGFADIVDAVVLVYADESTRLHRAMQRDKVGVQQVRQRMAYQSPQQELCRMADYVFDNSSPTDFPAQFDRLLRWIDTLPQRSVLTHKPHI